MSQVIHDVGIAKPDSGGPPREPKASSGATIHFADFDKIQPGDEASCHKTISTEDVDAFARLSGDTNPLHMDEKIALRTDFRGRVVHGLLLASYVSALVGMQCPGPGTIWSQQNFRWQSPVFIGDRIHLKLRVVHKSIGSRALTTCDLGPRWQSPQRPNHGQRLDGRRQESPSQVTGRQHPHRLARPSKAGPGASGRYRMVDEVTGPVIPGRCCPADQGTTNHRSRTAATASLPPVALWQRIPATVRSGGWTSLAESGQRRPLRRMRSRLPCAHNGRKPLGQSGRSHDVGELHICESGEDGRPCVGVELALAAGRFPRG